MTFAIRDARGGPDDLDAIVRVTDEVTPDDPTSIQEMAWADATYPGTTRFLAEDGDRPLGVGTVGRIYMHPPEFDALWATIAVIPEVRRRGIGTALLAAISERARVAGKGWLQIPATEARPEGIAFLIGKGFTELERAKMVKLDLAGLAPPAIRPPAGMLLTTLADRPELIAGVYAVALEAFPDIPGGDEPISVGELSEFRARDVDRPGILPEAFMVGVEATTGRVIGYASLMLIPGSTSVAWHDMTAVVHDWRGRGVAGALKRATIAWAIDHGLTALETGNDLDNTAMRAVNARLGFRPLPDLVTMRGRPFDGIIVP